MDDFGGDIGVYAFQHREWSMPNSAGPVTGAGRFPVDFLFAKPEWANVLPSGPMLVSDAERLTHENVALAALFDELITLRARVAALEAARDSATPISPAKPSLGETLSRALSASPTPDAYGR